MADQLCTSTQVKNRLQNAAAGVVFSATDTTTIAELIDQVSDFIQDYTHRKLVPENAATYTFDTEAGYILRIPKGIRTITSMGVNATAHQPDTGGTYTTVPAADRLLRPLAVDLPLGWPPTEVRITRATPSGTIRAFGTIENGCTITGNFGFAATPPAIQAVAIDAVVAAFQSRKSGASGVMGAEADAITPWNLFFSRGSPQRMTLDRFVYWGIA
jgi:hypothetical protein